MLLGLDCGSTAVKAALFDEAGRMAAAVSGRIQQLRPAPQRIEQDMDALWRTAAGVIKGAIERAGVAPREITAIGVTGHGDGVYLTDRDGRSLGNGIMSQDSRGYAITNGWAAAGLFPVAERLTGQRPYPYAATTILAWIKRNEPERYAAIGRVMFCKDWLRYRLTGVFATDPTDASTAFTELRSQRYDPAVLSLYGLDELAPALPPIAESCAPIGAITAQAAQATGLAEGAPVSGGLHDVTSSALGLGNLDPGVLSITAGTFSINETLSDRPICDPRWSTRAGLRPGQWMNMSISPASSNNVDWFMTNAYGAEIAEAAARGGSVWTSIESDLARPPRAARPIFHPFLFGSPYDVPSAASFFGLKSWHDRVDMLCAVMEGVAFNHRTHADALASAFPLRRAGLSGGNSSSPRTAQLFADVLGMPVDIPEAREVGALGAALAAGVGVGVYVSLEDAVARACRVAASYDPDAGRHAALTRRFHRYVALVDAVRPFWAADEESEPASADAGAGAGS